jgi:hypothetical protein
LGLLRLSGDFRAIDCASCADDQRPLRGNVTLSDYAETMIMIEPIRKSIASSGTANAQAVQESFPFRGVWSIEDLPNCRMSNLKNRLADILRAVEGNLFPLIAFSVIVDAPTTIAVHESKNEISRKIDGDILRILTSSRFIGNDTKCSEISNQTSTTYIQPCCRLTDSHLRLWGNSLSRELNGVSVLSMQNQGQPRLMRGINDTPVRQHQTEQVGVFGGQRHIRPLLPTVVRKSSLWWMMECRASLIAETLRRFLACKFLIAIETLSSKRHHLAFRLQTRSDGRHLLSLPVQLLSADRPLGAGRRNSDHCSLTTIQAVAGKARRLRLAGLVT